VADVVLRDGESPEALLRRFRKKVQRAGVLRDARKKRWFMSKSEQRRIAKRKAIRKHRRRQWKQNNRHRRLNGRVAVTQLERECINGT
jgi:small subunit ribosomal protein S21